MTSSRAATAEHVDFSKKSAQEIEQQQHTLRKGADEKGKYCRARKAENVLLNMTLF